MTFRVWFKNGSAVLITDVDTPLEARLRGQSIAEENTKDIQIAYKTLTTTHPERARELKREWSGWTTITKVEQL